MNATSISNNIRLGLLSAAISFLAGIGAPASSVHASPSTGTVDLLATPPELTTTVDPNVVVTFDDSGSMMATSLPDALSGRYGNQYYYTALNNFIYFDPTKTYVPPIRADGTSFPNATYTNAWRDGICANAPGSYCYGAANRINLSTRFYRGFAKITSTGDSPNATAGNDISSGVRGGTTGRYNGGFYFTCPTAMSNTGCVATYINDEPAAVQQNFANWYSYYRTRNLLARSSITRSFARISGDVRVAWQTINGDFSVTPPRLRGREIKKNVGAWRDDFYNWIFNVVTTGNTPNRRAMMEAGHFFERPLTSDDMNPYWEFTPDGPTRGRNLSCRKNFNMQVTDGYWNFATHPARPAIWNDGQTSVTLPDGRSFSTGDAESRIIWDVRDTKVDTSMANIGFNYWSRDLQPTLDNNVTPYIPDRTTGVTGGTPLLSGENPLDNREIYWNPVNDPASWQHVSQFMITLGIAGQVDFPGDYSNLRLGNPVLDGGTGWPMPLNNHPTGADDTWHAAVNGRGNYFSASDPEQLVQSLSDILSSILAQSAASTPITASLPLITAGTTGYAASYLSTDWSGSVTRHNLDANSQPELPPVWDAACLLTGGNCPSTGTTVAQVLAPGSRRIFTSDGTPGTGKPFRWTSLSPIQQARLNVNPSTINLTAVPPTPVYLSDGLGSDRLDYIRGDRARESSGTPRFRTRGSLLGAVIKGEPVYVSSPISGFRDIFPAGTPEEAAAQSGDSYSKFQFDNRARNPNVYVGANDGMLHAFDASTGVEQWAYVPNALIENFHLTQVTDANAGLISGVDDAPQQIDVFINGQWRTYLIGSLRLGGRGIYALDVTAPAPGSEGAAASAVPKWEFTNVAPSSGGGTDCAAGARFCTSLGYTYDSVSVARLAHDDRWVVLASSGYFPEDIADPASAESGARRTSLLVIDLETGTLIREIRTPPPTSGISYGLSTATVYDFGSDQIDDIAVAGDLAGNLWRFDLTGDPSTWKADLMFTSYGDGVAVGDQPISFNPTAMRDPVNRVPMFIFGTGKYVGKPDRTSSIPQQVYYGIRDYGTCRSGSPACSIYPITPASLEEQVMTQAPRTGGDGKVYQVRTIEKNATPLVGARGWKLLLGSYDNTNSGMSASPGERAQRRAFPFYSANLAMLFTLTPRGEDPCAPGNDYGFVIVDAATGSFSSSNGPVTSAVVGVSLPSSRPLGSPTVPPGGGDVKITGIDNLTLPPDIVDAVESALKGADDVWHRGAWRELLNLF
jgi:type IV pilus assembly protein PilY1